MELLQSPSDPGYPAEYLLARIRGRRSRLISDWKSLINGMPETPTSDEAWGRLLREHQWAFRQMNGLLRVTFRPYFIHAELRTVCICLRRISKRGPDVPGELFGGSLLSDAVREVLTTGPDLKTVLSELERIFTPLSERFSGFGEMLETGGLRAVEQRLAEACLGWAVRTARLPLMKDFFSRLIDGRNLIAVAKGLEWEAQTEPSLLPGGRIPLIRLREAMRQRDGRRVERLVHDATGLSIGRADAPSVGRALYQGMSQRLRKAGRDPFGAAPILDYLWRCSVEAMNLSLLHHGRELGREIVATELVM